MRPLDVITMADWALGQGVVCAEAPGLRGSSRQRAASAEIIILIISTAFLQAVLIIYTYSDNMSFQTLSFFCLAMKASTRSMTCGTRSMIRSTVLLAGGVTFIILTTPSFITRKPMGSIFTPVALPPP